MVAILFFKKKRSYHYAVTRHKFSRIFFSTGLLHNLIGAFGTSVVICLDEKFKFVQTIH